MTTTLAEPAAAALTGAEVERLRLDFPALAQEIGGRPVAYLDNAASAQKPRAVIDAVAHAYAYGYANVHRGVHTLAQRATDAYEGARRKAARFLGGVAPEEVVFVRGTTEAINLVARAYAAPRLGAGDEVLVTALEHHSNIVPWQLVCRERGARLVVAPIEDDGSLDVAAFERLVSPRTRLVALAHVSNALGTINPLAELIRLAHDRGAPVLVDGAQAAPHLELDVGAGGADFYTVSGHKAYGPTGIGLLYGRRALLEAMDPYQGGGEMIEKVTFEGSTWAELPHKFEAGTPHIVGAIGLGAAIDYLVELGVERAAAWEDNLHRRASERLARIPGVRLLGTAPHKAAVVTFTVDGVHPHDVGTVLDSEGVAVRAGHHCAQPVHARLGVPASVRASFAFYNTLDEVERLAAGVERAAALLGR